MQDTQPSPTASAPQDSSSDAAAVLVVDDEAPNRDLLALLLRSQGYRVVTASDGPSALAAIRQGAIGLVLVDVMMPRMDGIELCHAIRETLQQPNLPVVFVSSLSDRESRVRAKEAGADDYLVKPIDTLELLVRVENLWKLRKYNELIERHKEVLERELAQASERMLHLERLSVVGSLAAGVGHELGNLSGILRGSLELVRMTTAQGGPPDARDLAKLERVASHLENHAARLLRLGQPRNDQAQEVSLNAVVAGAVELVQGTGRVKHASIALELPKRAPRVRLAASQLEQVVFNLVLNASDALLDVQGRPRQITVRVEERDALERTRLLVIDTGHGINEEDLAKVFEPYFTTKPEGSGTGLGLNLVRQIVEAVDGRVVLLSQPGTGTTAVVDFPALPDGPNAAEIS
jgi:signal transduction histidine kinase